MSLKYEVNELMKGILDPGFEWKELEIKQGAVEDDCSENSVPSGPLNAEDYPVVPETLLEHCAPPRYGIFNLYGKSRMNFLFIQAVL